MIVSNLVLGTKPGALSQKHNLSLTLHILIVPLPKQTRTAEMLSF